MLTVVQAVRVRGLRWIVSRVPSARTRPQTKFLKALEPFARVAVPSGRQATVVASKWMRS
jgi:hypothetical protein